MRRLAAPRLLPRSSTWTLSLTKTRSGLRGSRRVEAPSVLMMWSGECGCSDLESAVGPVGLRDHRRKLQWLLQSYIQSSLKDGQGGPEIATWEQGGVDGRFFTPVSGYKPGRTIGPIRAAVPSITSPTGAAHVHLTTVSRFAPQDSSDNMAPHQEQKVAVEEQLSNPSANEPEKAGDAEQREEIQENEQPQHEAKIVEEEAIKQADELNEVREDPKAEQVQDQRVPVHRGQPEI
ncbi:hypothetical protein EXN66_Car001964 [Channa argus]|uniref:Uncharacterized protein n=1 Tax=Channa argus TaxID=215402 RepID=A0A6G1P7T5_CHAAH|nr:hypothetical protein EXN66_Car001964 [Channa argus]